MLSRSRRYQKRQQDKGLCTNCGNRELYSCYYCKVCWKKHLKKQEKYRRSKGIISRKEYYIKLKNKSVNKSIKLNDVQEKFNRLKKLRNVLGIKFKKNEIKSCLNIVIK